MTNLIAAALAPTLICAIYIFIRDKYEKEPIGLLVTGVLYGVIVTVPIIHAENLVTIFIPNSGILMEAFYHSFIVASLVEEFFKFTVLYYLVWRNKNFNEKFDGIVYAVFISLGFAGVENVLYVLNPDMGGMETAISRAVFSVPGHAFFGVTMGYYFAMARFEPERHKLMKFRAFLTPFILHGVYDFILLSGMKYVMFVFVPFVLYMWYNGFKKMKRHVESSPFKASRGINGNND